jgi:iron complex outermembrane recepter protein
MAHLKTQTGGYKMSLIKGLLITTAAALAVPAAAQTAAPSAPTAPAAPAKAETSAEKKDAPKTVAAPAAASAAAQPQGGLMEIVVTARRVGERLQDVPLSIRALGAAELESKGIANISELSTYTPGLTYSPDFGRTAERPVIRGISALRPEAPQPVSVFVNGVFVRDGALGLLLDDAARVEVIKGPQSALYGRSTYAGAINYITKRPGNELEGKVTATVGSNGEQSLFAAVTVPLGNWFSARIRAKNYDYDGQYTNSQTGNKIGNERTRSAGGEFLFKISPSFDVLGAFEQAKDRDGIFNATVRTVPIQAAGVITSQNGTQRAELINL